MQKLKLLALIYGPEDQQFMSNWLAANAQAFEIVEWTRPIEVPIQSAVAHFSETNDVDGLLIDDHRSYDPIVINKLSELLKPAKMFLYSTTNLDLPVVAPAQPVPTDNVIAANDEKKPLPLYAVVNTDCQNLAKHPARVAV